MDKIIHRGVMHTSYSIMDLLQRLRSWPQCSFFIGIVSLYSEVVQYLGEICLGQHEGRRQQITL